MVTAALKAHAGSSTHWLREAHEALGPVWEWNRKICGKGHRNICRSVQQLGQQELHTCLELQNPQR